MFSCSAHCVARPGTAVIDRAARADSPSVMAVQPLAIILTDVLAYESFASAIQSLLAV